jgi:uncharacterized membrane protein YdjX (TVP38/TMEM64 family)
LKRILFTILFLVLAIFLIMQTEIGHLLREGNVEEVARNIQSFGWIALFIAVGAIIIQTFFPVIPFVLLAGANVIVFGLWFGFAISWTSAVVAAMLNFLLARYAARDFAERKMGHHPFVQKLNEQSEKRGFWIILMARFIPVLPSSVINTAAGISRVLFPHFFYATLLGKFPAVFFESLLGHYVIHWKENKGKLILIAIALLLFTLSLIYLKKRKKKDVFILNVDTQEKESEGNP